MDAISTAAAGVQAGLSRFDSASQSLMKAFDPGSTANPASSVVDQISASEQAQTSAAVVRVGDRMLKQLLDITV